MAQVDSVGETPSETAGPAALPISTGLRLKRRGTFAAFVALLCLGRVVIFPRDDKSIRGAALALWRHGFAICRRRRGHAVRQHSSARSRIKFCTDFTDLFRFF